MVDDLTTSLGMAGTGVLGMLTMGAFTWFQTRRQTNAQTDAVIADATGKTTLIEALEARIAAGESRQNAQDNRIADLENRIGIEVDLRLKSQEENHILRLRVTQLEFAIKQLGGAVPA